MSDEIPIEVIKQVDAYIAKNVENFWAVGRGRCRSCGYLHNTVGPVAGEDIEKEKDKPWECTECGRTTVYYIHDPLIYFDPPRDIILNCWGIEVERSMQGMYGDGI